MQVWRSRNHLAARELRFRVSRYDSALQRVRRGSPIRAILLDAEINKLISTNGFIAGEFQEVREAGGRVVELIAAEGLRERWNGYGGEN